VHFLVARHGVAEPDLAKRLRACPSASGATRYWQTTCATCSRTCGIQAMKHPDWQPVVDQMFAELERDGPRAESYWRSSWRSVRFWCMPRLRLRAAPMVAVLRWSVASNWRTRRSARCQNTRRGRARLAHVGEPAARALGWRRRATLARCCSASVRRRPPVLAWRQRAWQGAIR